MTQIVVPDDYPSILASNQAFRNLRDSTPVSYFPTLPGAEDELIRRIAGSEVVINVRSSSRFSERVLESSPKLKLISIWGTGTDNVDLPAAARLGIAVTNTPGVSAYSVAEHTLALLFAAARQIPAQDRAVRNGEWPRGQGIELRGKTLGVIGLGAIGRRFAELGQGIGMSVIAWTVNPRPVPGVTAVDLDTLLRESEVISLHVRLSPQTKGMLGAREFDLMKPSAILVNTARGAIVDEPALIQALETNRIAAAGLDVFATEPLPPGHPLTKLPNVVLSPHSAGITPEALNAGLEMAVTNVLAFLAGEPAHLVVR